MALRDETSETDFVSAQRLMRSQLVSGRGHYETVVREVMQARVSVWIATANLKEMLVEDTRLLPARRRGRGAYRSILASLAERIEAGVEVRILHAEIPSRAFRDAFDEHPHLLQGLQMRICPRVHLKTVIVDGRLLYLGSANWTGAGLGAKGARNRNFELGLVTEDEAMLDQVQGLYEHLWQGEPCSACGRRELCPSPIR